MAPLPPETTTRVFVDYAVDDVEHTLMVRAGPDVDDIEEAINNLAAILTFIENSLPTSWAVQGVRVAAQGSTISLPFDYSATNLFGFTGASATPLPEANHPRELVWVGRSPTSGRRVRFSLYGALFNTPANYRFGPGESDFSSSQVISALNAATLQDTFLAIDGTRPTWYSYVNVNFNSYWESERRSSS